MNEYMYQPPTANHTTNFVASRILKSTRGAFAHEQNIRTSDQFVKTNHRKSIIQKNAVKQKKTKSSRVCAQRSFITADLATKLNVQKEGSENLNIVSFGNKTSCIRNLDKTTVQLKANNGEIIPIKVLIVITIASPLQSQSRKITQGLHYLHGSSLAHPVTDAESFELTLLIAADFYWNIVQDKEMLGNGSDCCEL
ncbi:Hypothetical predicted protein [Mytilus galloprovincialis]|uniref:DUF1758 domain-containing protein n=1 Tax=Mytilus galloprovincialis TaxID=29158 RepID=A0A8B6GWI5_MYTGA|nr:Hypothetical predicted protein [Mytilus galloprovincialis]